MNVTLSIDDQLVARARELARRQGTSLNQMIRDYIQTIVGEPSGDVIARELLDLMEEQGGRSGGVHFPREDAYEGRL